MNVLRASRRSAPLRSRRRQPILFLLTYEPFAASCTLAARPHGDGILDAAIAYSFSPKCASLPLVVVSRVVSVPRRSRRSVQRRGAALSTSMR